MEDTVSTSASAADKGKDDLVMTKKKLKVLKQALKDEKTAKGALEDKLKEQEA